MPLSKHEPNDTKLSNTLNANQFDNDGLPGIDEDYPPENLWPVDVSTPVASDNETAPTTVGALIADQGDPQDSPGDDNKQATASTGRRDPDAGISAEEAAMHIVEPDTP